MAGTLALPALHSIFLTGAYPSFFVSVSVSDFSQRPNTVFPGLPLHILAYVNTRRSRAYLFHDPRTWLRSVPSASDLIHDLM